jgi:modification methylase
LYRVLLASTNPGDVVLDPFFGTGTTGAMAKKLGRHYIGIERDQEYVRLARTRIAAIETSPEEALTGHEKRRQARIPFGALLEAGLLTAGQTLYFAPDPSRQATVLADGSLRCGRITGSIHAVAKQLVENAPANGWDLWLYQDISGARLPIDRLRDEIRNATAQENNLETP